MGKFRIRGRFHVAMAAVIPRRSAVANCMILAFGELCNHHGGMIYRFLRLGGYIVIVSNTPAQTKKGKTMAPKTLTTVIWDFPVRIFNIARKKIDTFARDRALADERWLNG
jgi:hypothetical protein